MRFFSIILLSAAFLFPGRVHAQWEVFESGVSSNLFDIQFVDPSCGWAAGDNATVLFTIDGGETWVEQDIPVSDFVAISHIQFLDTMTGYIMGSGRLKTQDPDSLGIYENVFLRTVDGGTTWEHVPVMLEDTVPHMNEFHFIDNRTGWVAGSMERGGGNGIIGYTADGGDTWTKQLQVTSLQYQLISVRFIDSMEGWALGIVMMDNFNETDLYHTVNGGADWENIYTFPGATYSLTTSAPNSLWLCRYGFNYSGDGGVSWFSNPGVSNGSARDIEPTGPESAWILYNGEPDIIRHTSDGGQTFDLELPLSGDTVWYAIDVAEYDGGFVIWASGSDGALLRYHQTVTAIDSQPLEAAPLTVSAHPNPFNPSTIIRFSLPAEGHTRLTIYNIAGQRVATLLNENMSAGTHEAVFDGTAVSSGIYVYRLQTGDRSRTGKVLLMK